MAWKPLLLLLASFLLLTTRVASDEAEFVTEHATVPAKAPAHAPVKAPAHAPVKAPRHAPVKAPAHAPAKAPLHHAPVNAPHHAPVKAPAHAPAKTPPHHAPEKAPAHAPAKSPPHHAPVKAPAHAPSKAPPPMHPHGCTPMCEERCKTHHHQKRSCMKVCTACCAKCKCVPPGTSGNEEKCKNWDHVILHSQMVKCP